MTKQQKIAPRESLSKALWIYGLVGGAGPDVHGQAGTEDRSDDLPVGRSPMHARVIRPTLETAVEAMVVRPPSSAGEEGSRSAVSIAQENVRRCR